MRYTYILYWYEAMATVFAHSRLNVSVKPEGKVRDERDQPFFYLFKISFSFFSLYQPPNRDHQPSLVVLDCFLINQRPLDRKQTINVHSCGGESDV